MRRLRQQRRFLKENEQKMFDKGLEDVEELKLLEALKHAASVERIAYSLSSLDEFLSSDIFSASILE